MNTIIINADDYGLTETCTKAIIDAYERDLITDTTMCINGEAVDQALRMVHNHSLRNHIGLHLNITRGFPVTDGLKQFCCFCDQDGRLHKPTERNTRLTPEEEAALYTELCAQFELFKETGLRMTHVDSHHHVHTAIGMRKIFDAACEKYNVKIVRLTRNVGKMSPLKKVCKAYFNHVYHMEGFTTADYFGGIDDYENFVRDGKICEIMVHPDYAKDGTLIDRTKYLTGMVPYGRPLLKQYFPQQAVYSSYSELLNELECK